MVPLHIQLANSTLRRVIKRLHFPLEIMLVCVRWYAAYPLSLRNLEEMMAERGVRRFFECAIDLHDVPASITIDKSGANTAAVRGLIADSGAAIELRQSKYLNNVVEQDRRTIKRRTRPMMGFKSFRSAVRIFAGIETLLSVKKGPLGRPGGLAFSAAGSSYSLAAA
jgi:transposase-like protein